MHSSSGFAATVAFLVASLVIAAPVTDNREASTFSISQIKNPSFKGFVASGVVQRAKAYAKYGKPLPADVAAAVSGATSSGNVSANVSANPQQYGSEYLCPVQIGTPAQTLQLNFDTGSADLWVFSSQTRRPEVKGQKLYKPSSSSTAVLLPNASWYISYVDSSYASGDVYNDVVSVGGVSYYKQAVESAKIVSHKFSQDSACSGFLGLAFTSLNSVYPEQQNTFFANVINSLASPVFTVDLKKGIPGTYDFGFINSSKYTGSISYTSVNTANGFWEFTGSGYAVGLGSFNSLSIDAIVDSGTTLLLLPDSVVSAYYNQVKGAQNSTSVGGYIFPCNATLPNFTFGVGLYRGVIPGSYINYAPATSTECYGGIQSDDGFDFSIYGNILLKAQFVVFDGGNNSLGFANKPT